MSSDSENLNAHLLDAIRSLTAKVDTLGLQVAASNVQMAELKTEMRIRPQCPKPGACLELEVEIAELHKRLTPLEAKLQQSVGGKRMLYVILTICTALGGIIGAKITKLLDVAAAALSN